MYTSLNKANKLLPAALFVISLLIGCSPETNSEEEEQSDELFLTVQSFSVEIPEITQDGSMDSPGTVSVETNIQEPLSFSLENTQPPNSIGIDPETGEIIVLNSYYFDYEFFQEISSEVIVRGDSLSSKADIVITISDRQETNGFVYDDSFYALDKLREYNTNLSSVFDLRLASPTIEYYNHSGTRGTGEYLGFSFTSQTFEPEMEELSYTFSVGANDDFLRDRSFVQIEQDFDILSPSIDWRDIVEGQLHYRRYPYTGSFRPEMSLFRAFNYELHFYFVFSDGTVLRGNFERFGESSYFRL